MAEIGILCEIIFLRLQSPELAIARVRQRVNAGGHNIPELVIRAGDLSNLETLYKPLVNEWAVYDNSNEVPELLEENAKV